MTLEELQAANVELTDANAVMTAQVATMTGETASMKAKMDELLGETKAAKEARRLSDAKAADDAAAAALRDGNFEQLHKSSEERYQSTLGELDKLKTGMAGEKRSNAAMKIASELADGSNAELLSTFIANRLVFSDDSVKVTDASGQLTVSSLADLSNEFKNDSKFASLLKGNQSAGGGASGGNNSGGAAKSKTRAEFQALNPAEQSSFARTAGNTITD